MVHVHLDQPFRHNKMHINPLQLFSTLLPGSTARCYKLVRN